MQVDAQKLLMQEQTTKVERRWLSTVWFECKSDAVGRCSQAGYQPGDDGWNEAWDILGSCTGTLAPTASPANGLADAGGCPEAFDAGVNYKLGEKVAFNSMVFKCKSDAVGRCSQAGYQPGDDGWNEA